MSKASTHTEKIAILDWTLLQQGSSHGLSMNYGNNSFELENENKEDMVPTLASPNSRVCSNGPKCSKPTNDLDK